MNILFEYIIVFLQIYIAAIFISGCGFLLKKQIFDLDEKSSFENNILWGFIFISFISLIVNFFLPLSLYINTAIFILLSSIILQKKYFSQSLKKFLKKSLIISTLAFILIIHSNVNNPDALLYHLPFSEILNEHKIIIGASNIHHRFAHISIFQYPSSSLYILLIGKNGLLISLGILGSSFLIYCLKEFRILFKSKNSRISSFVIFLILIVSIYSFNRYSNYGNDVPVHIYYYLIIIYIFKFNLDYQNNLLIKKISLLSLYAFFLKPFYIFTIFIPLIFLLLNRNYKPFFKSLFFLFSLIFSIAWFLKNFLISSCLIFPIKFTCIKSVTWSNLLDIDNQSLLGEVHSKSWGDRLNDSITPFEYIKDFNWLDTWLNNHFEVVMEKFIPIIIFLVLVTFFLYLSKLIEEKKFLYANKITTFIILFISLFSSIMWFLKFPIYRYGQSYLFISILIFLYLIVFYRINESKIFNFKKFFNLLIILAFVGLVGKNLNRISNKFSDSIMPNMYDNIIHKNISKKFFNKNNIFTHYIKNDGSLCGYSISPCSEKLNKNLMTKNMFGYMVYFIDKSN